MASSLRIVVGLALFVGVGFGAPYFYQKWIVSAVKNAPQDPKLDPSKLKAVEGNFSNVKFDQPLQAVPRFDNQPRTHPVRR
jgi:hypothetical protein